MSAWLVVLLPWHPTPVPSLVMFPAALFHDRRPENVCASRGMLREVPFAGSVLPPIHEEAD